jgi:hypothetical protein
MMKIELQQVENISKNIIKDFDKKPDQKKGAKKALEMLITYFKELEEYGPQHFDITWSEEDVENAFPEIHEDDRAEVLQNFEDELDNSDGVWDRMWECLNIVGQQFIEQNPPKKELRPTIIPQK